MVEANPESDAQQNYDPEEVWVGIDLGTTNSCIGIWKQNEQRVDIVQDDTGA